MKNNIVSYLIFYDIECFWWEENFKKFWYTHALLSPDKIFPVILKAHREIWREIKYLYKHSTVALQRNSKERDRATLNSHWLTKNKTKTTAIYTRKFEIRRAFRNG